MDEEVEARIRACWDDGDYDGAASEALRSYGPAVYRFLCLRMPAPDQADEVFAQLGEDLWKGLPSFGWRSAFSTWMYTLARNGAHRYLRSPANQVKRRTGLTREMEGLVQEVRTQTRPYIVTTVKDRFSELRERLDPEDRSLLLLRVNQGLSWNEVAKVMEDDPGLEGAALTRASGRMRQRFQKIKDTLRRLAEEEGLLDQETSE